MCLATAALAPGFGVLVVTEVRSGLCQCLPKKATNGHASKVRWTRSRSAHIDLSLHSWRRRWKENKKACSRAQATRLQSNDTVLPVIEQLEKVEFVLSRG